MPQNIVIGELEQLVLLAVLRLGEDSYALPVQAELGRILGRSVSRGALYRTLDRLEGKGLLTWQLDREGPRRGGHPRRCFQVTASGVATLRASRRVLTEFWAGLEELLQ